MKDFIPWCLACLPLLLWFVIPFLPTIMAAREPTLAPAERTVESAPLDRLEAVVLVDGDTIKVDIYLGRGVLLRGATIWLEGLDTCDPDEKPAKEGTNGPGT